VPVIIYIHSRQLLLFAFSAYTANVRIRAAAAFNGIALFAFFEVCPFMAHWATA